MRGLAVGGTGRGEEAKLKQSSGCSGRWEGRRRENKREERRKKRRWKKISKVFVCREDVKEYEEDEEAKT